MEFQNKKEVLKTLFQNKTQNDKPIFNFQKQKREFKHNDFKQILFETTYILFI